MNLDRDSLFIGGEWTTPASGELMQVISPHSEEVVATVPDAAAAVPRGGVPVTRRSPGAPRGPPATPAQAQRR